MKVLNIERRKMLEIETGVRPKPYKFITDDKEKTILDIMDKIVDKLYEEQNLEARQLTEILQDFTAWNSGKKILPNTRIENLSSITRFLDGEAVDYLRINILQHTTDDKEDNEFICDCCESNLDRDAVYCHYCGVKLELEGKEVKKQKVLNDYFWDLGKKDQKHIVKKLKNDYPNKNPIKLIKQMLVV